MIALVLVGGEGTRLRPLTNDTPKPMLPIVGRPMVGRIIEWLCRHGIERVVFSLAYRADAFREAFPSGRYDLARLDYAEEPSPLDTAGAIRFAAIAAGVADEELVICNGDVLTDLDLTSLRAFHHERGAAATVAVAPVEDTSVYGVAVTGPNGRIEAFVEKPAAGTAPSNLVNIGTYVFSPGLVHEIPADRRVSVEREIFPSLVDRGALFAFASEPYWLDTGTPERFVEAQLDILRGTNRGVAIDGAAGPAGGQYLGAHSRVEGELSGVVHLGSGVLIEPGAVVVDAVIGPDCVVQSGARVARSALLAGATIAKSATVEDSVLGPAAHAGERSVLRGCVIGNGVEIDEDERLDGARRPE